RGPARRRGVLGDAVPDVVMLRMRRMSRWSAHRFWVRAVVALAAPAGALLVAACGGSGGAGGAGGGACPSDLPPSCPSDAANYKATIVPLLKTKCEICHEPGGPSVNYLQTYAEVHA